MQGDGFFLSLKVLSWGVLSLQSASPVAASRCDCLVASRSLSLWCSPGDKLSFVWAVVVNPYTHTHYVFCIAFLSYVSRSFSFPVWWPNLPLWCCFPACFPEHHILDFSCAVGSVPERLFRNLFPAFTSLLAALSSPFQTSQSTLMGEWWSTSLIISGASLQK